MENEQLGLPTSVKIPSLVRATAHSAAYALASVLGTWLLWHYADNGLAFAPGLGSTSITRAGVDARDETLLITLGTLLASGVFWWKSFLGYWHVRNQLGDKWVDARDGIVLGWQLLLSLLLMGWLVADLVTVLGCLMSVGDEGRTGN